MAFLDYARILFIINNLQRSGSTHNPLVGGSNPSGPTIVKLLRTPHSQCLVPAFDGAFLLPRVEGGTMGQVLHRGATTTAADRSRLMRAVVVQHQVDVEPR